MIKNAHRPISSPRRIRTIHLGGIPEALSERRRAGLRRKPEAVTELDALVAYLQMLGTLVDFKLYEDRQKLR